MKVAQRLHPPLQRKQLLPHLSLRRRKILLRTSLAAILMRVRLPRAQTLLRRQGRLLL